MGYIGSKPANNFETVRKQVSTSNSGTTITLDYPVTSVADIRLTINAVVQSYDNYSVSGSTLTVGGTLNNDRVEILFVGRTYGSIAPTDASVGTSAIQDDAVTAAKLSSTAVDNTNTNSTLITAQTEKSSLVDADKFLISDSAASGALKYVQKSNLPSGGLQLVTSFTPSSEGSTIVVDNCFTSSYDRYLVFCERLRNGNGGARLDVYLRTGGSSGSDSCNLGGGYLGYRYNNAYISGSTNNSCQGTIVSSTESDRWYNAMFYVIQPHDSAFTTNIQGSSAYREGSTGNYGFVNFGYQADNTVSHTGFAIQLSTGNFNQTYSTVKVYGIVDS